jgi:hypothetical protein
VGAVARPTPALVRMVNSRSTPGVRHAVTRAPDGALRCSCKGFAYRHHCLHVGEVAGDRCPACGVLREQVVQAITHGESMDEAMWACWRATCGRAEPGWA